MTCTSCGYQHSEALAFEPGDRVEISPSCDLWMRGARFGTVRRTEGNRVCVKMDHRQVRKLQWFAPSDVRHAS